MIDANGPVWRPATTRPTIAKASSAKRRTSVYRPPRRFAPAAAYALAAAVLSAVVNGDAAAAPILEGDPIFAEVPAFVGTFTLDARSGSKRSTFEPGRPISSDLGWYPRLGTLLEQDLILTRDNQEFVPAPLAPGEDVSLHHMVVTTTLRWPRTSGGTYESELVQSGNPFCSDNASQGANGRCRWESQTGSYNISIAGEGGAPVDDPARGNPSLLLTTSGTAAGEMIFHETEIVIEQVYIPNSTADYVFNAIEDAGGSPTASSLTVPVLDNAWLQQIIPLRETSDATSSQNLNLRDAEYFLRGYSGGVRSRTGDSSTDGSNVDFKNAFFNTYVLYSAPGYALIKAPQSADGSEEELAGTPVGGVDISRLGWVQGAAGLNPDPTADAISFSDLLALALGDEAQSDVAGVDENVTPDDAQRPTFTTQDGQLNVNLFLFTAAEDVMRYFDPESADEYAYAVDGNLFVSILLPSGQGFSEFTLSFGELSLDLEVDQEFFFTDFLADGADSFALSNFNGPIQNDLVVGLTFQHAGASALIQTQSFDQVSIDEPPMLPFLAVSGLAMLARRRRRRTAGTRG